MDFNWYLIEGILIPFVQVVLKTLFKKWKTKICLDKLFSEIIFF